MNSDVTLTTRYYRLWTFKLGNIKENIFIDLLGNKLDKINSYL